ncbi:MAG: SprB repeat-containing protein [Flammeovirgaceae bacterium]|nr:MAG: SprB repeat-containing protein [Flammeovirgaceae bacterium]
MQLKTLLFYRLAGISLFVTTFLLSNCSSNDEPEVVNCATTDLAISLVSKTDPTNCTAVNGSISVTASGGVLPYQFKLDAGTFGTAAVFNNLGGGTFIITVRDNNGCEKELSVTLELPSGLTATETSQTSNSNCLPPYNGSVSVSASGGSGTYEYAIDGGVFGTSNSFNALKDGIHTITVKDVGDNCTFELSVNVGRLPTGVKYNGVGQIKELFQTKCSGGSCHPSNGDWFTYSSAFAKRNEIKSRTQSGDMPRGGGTLTQDQKDLIACWVDDGAPEN